MTEVKNGQPIGHVWHTDLLCLTSGILKKFELSFTSGRPTHTRARIISEWLCAQSKTWRCFHVAARGQWEPLPASKGVSASLLRSSPFLVLSNTRTRVCCQLWLGLFPSYVRINSGRAKGGQGGPRDTSCPHPFPVPVCPPRLHGIWISDLAINVQWKIQQSA